MIFLSLNIASDCILPRKAKHSSLVFVAAIVTVCVVILTLLLVGSLIFDGHDHDDEHDYGYVEELYEKLEYINHRIDELEERLEE